MLCSQTLDKAQCRQYFPNFSSISTCVCQMCQALHLNSTEKKTPACQANDYSYASGLEIFSNGYVLWLNLGKIEKNIFLNRLPSTTSESLYHMRMRTSELQTMVLNHLWWYQQSMHRSPSLAWCFSSTSHGKSSMETLKDSVVSLCSNY